MNTPSGSLLDRSIIGRRVMIAGGLSLIFTACEGKSMHGTFDVVLFSYLDRPIFDVLVSGFDVGVAGEYPYSGRGSMSGVSMKYGLHPVSWRLGGPEGMPRNGETVKAKNTPELVRPTEDHRYLGMHIYADDTVEFVTSRNFPELSERGKAFDATWRAKHGK